MDSELGRAVDISAWSGPITLDWLQRIREKYAISALIVQFHGSAPDAGGQRGVGINHYAADAIAWARALGMKVAG